MSGIERNGLTNGQLRAAPVPVTVSGAVLAPDAATETTSAAILAQLNAESEAAPRTAFGEQSHAPPDCPLVEESFQYGVNPKDISSIIIGTGTVTASGATGSAYAIG